MWFAPYLHKRVREEVPDILDRTVPEELVVLEHNLTACLTGSVHFYYI